MTNWTPEVHPGFDDDLFNIAASHSDFANGHSSKASCRTLIFFLKFWWWFWRPEDHLNCCLFEALCKVSFRFFLNAAILIWFQLLPGQPCKNSRKSNWPVYYIWSIRVNAWKLRESAKLRISPKEGSITASSHTTHLGQEAKASLTGIIICAHAMRAPVKSWILGGGVKSRLAGRQFVRPHVQKLM